VGYPYISIEDEDLGSGEDEDGNEAESMGRQIRRTHVVAPPMVLAQENDRVLIMPFVDRYEHLLLFSLVDSIHYTHFFAFYLVTCGYTKVSICRGHKR
jgi:hypothetical protein